MYLKIILKLLISYSCIGFGGICNLNNSPTESVPRRNIFLDYNDFPEATRLKMKQKAKEMFYFGYDNYMKHAFPLDELNPIYCTGRGPDKENP